MKRRRFLKLVSAMLCQPSLALPQEIPLLNLQICRILYPASASQRTKTAATVLAEEAEKRCGLRWTTAPIRQEQHITQQAVVVYIASRNSATDLVNKGVVTQQELGTLQEEGFLLRTGRHESTPWIAVIGADDRGVLFGVGRLLRRIKFGRWKASVPPSSLHEISHPEYKLRGHQLGYRPKTNSYDGWSVQMWDQYIRELALFGANAIELIPPHSDDLKDSSQFPLPPAEMMVEMCRMADGYGLQVWVWQPAMAPSYSTQEDIAQSLEDWAKLFAMLPHIDAVLVPGGDPGDTPPALLLALLEKQAANLRHYHPGATMWISPQSFNATEMNEFLHLIKEPRRQQWLTGLVFGPQSRLSLQELRQAVPAHYQIRCYPDITHSVQCQYPVPDWDVAYAVTEGREVINPRPRGMANIAHRILPGTVGFISYSEGCNDDVNKMVWSSLAWNSSQSVIDILIDYSHFFIGTPYAESFARGLLALESNWVGPLALNHGVEVTLQQFRDMEDAASPALLQNWRFQQGLYRAYYDAFVRRRLLAETGSVEQTLDTLATLLNMGWAPAATEYDDPTPMAPPNGLLPAPVLAHAQTILEAAIASSPGTNLRTRVHALGEALFQSIHMQLAVERYQGEAIERGANLDTLDTPVTDLLWLHRNIALILSLPSPMAQVAAVRKLLFRTDPGPGGFYDHLGDVANRPHLVPGPGGTEDPEFRHSALTGFAYPEPLHDTAPMAWKSWAGSHGDAPLTLHYDGLDPEAQYKLRVVHSGDAPEIKLRLVANGALEIHPYILRAWPPAPQEFLIPRAASAQGELTLVWTRESGQGGNGRGCQVSEVWLIRS